jgi:hypothetical protein
MQMTTCNRTACRRMRALAGSTTGSDKVRLAAFCLRAVHR